MRIQIVPKSNVFFRTRPFPIPNGNHHPVTGCGLSNALAVERVCGFLHYIDFSGYDPRGPDTGKDCGLDRAIKNSRLVLFTHDRFDNCTSGDWYCFLFYKQRQDRMDETLIFKLSQLSPHLRPDFFQDAE